MMTNNRHWSAERWANQITLLLNIALGVDRFPVQIGEIAKEYSHQVFPSDPITVVKGHLLPDFEGALFRAPSRKSGWGIFYNDSIASRGRINFTLGHEFGHYLLHRELYPEGLQCREDQYVRWDSELGQIEQQANLFAANLLMPHDDFRRLAPVKDKITLEELGECAARYDVSLVACILRWLDFTERRAVLVLSRDGFILWARSSAQALRTGAFFRTSNLPPVAVPIQSLAHQIDKRGLITQREMPEATWFQNEGCVEEAVSSTQHDFVVSLLHLSSSPPSYL